MTCKSSDYMNNSNSSHKDKKKKYPPKKNPTQRQNMEHSETAVKGIVSLWVTQEKRNVLCAPSKCDSTTWTHDKSCNKRRNNERSGLHGNSNVWSYIGSSFETKPWWLNVLWLRSLNILISRSQFSFHDASEAAINYLQKTLGRHI